MPTNCNYFLSSGAVIMHHNSCIPFFLVGLLSFYVFLSCVSSCSKEPKTPDWRMTLKTIRNGIHNIDKYLNVALDLFGGQDGLCHYECSDGYKPEPRPGYKPTPPNGCGSPLFGFQFDIGIPSLTKCCNQHDRCYDTCNRDKHDCDDEFQECLETICRRLQKMLGLAQSVQVDIDNPSLTKFCDQHNCCYAICNSDKDDCDDEFQECLERDFCRRLQKMLGLA